MFILLWDYISSNQRKLFWENKIRWVHRHLRDYLNVLKENLKLIVHCPKGGTIEYKTTDVFLTSGTTQ